MLWALFVVTIFDNGKIDYSNIGQVEVFQTRIECELERERLSYYLTLPVNKGLVCMKVDEV